MKWKNAVAVFLVLALASSSPARQNSPQRIHDQVNTIAIGGPLTVEMIDGRELHGYLSSIETDTFTIREVDLMQTVAIRYSETSRVYKNYGGKGFGGRRVHPQNRLLIMVLVVGGLIGLAFFGATQTR